MSLSRAAPFAVAIFAAALAEAQAQMPGQTPPCVEQFIPLRQEMEKHFTAAQSGIHRKAQAPELCRLLTQFTEAEGKVIKYVEENGPRCNFPSELLPAMKTRNVKSRELRSQACAAAARPARPTAPSLSDALSAPIPDASTTKTGRGTLDSLSGNPLAR